jgi:hypothetical protein
VVQQSKLEESAVTVFAENQHRLFSYPAAGEELPEPDAD